MDLFREKHTPQTECGPSQRVSAVALKCGVISFYGLGNFIFWERGGNFQELGHHPLFGLLVVPWNCHGASECVI